MWQDVQEQVISMLEQTRTPLGEAAAHVSEVLGKKVSPSELSHVLNDSRSETKKGREILLAVHQYLTTKLEDQNRTLINALRRGKNALENAQA